VLVIFAHVHERRDPRLRPPPSPADRVAVFWVQNGAGRMIETGDVAQIFGSPRDPLTATTINGIRG
jgi:hypothetical protein